jgi:predicted PurR-regulated permease PerM
VLIAGLAGMANGLARAADDIAQAVGGITEIFNGLISFIQNVFTGQWGAAFDSLKMVAQGFYDLITGIFGGILSFVGGFIDGFIGFFASLYDTLLGHSIIPDIVNGIKNWFAKLPGMVLEGIKQFGESIKNYFIDAKDGVIGTLNDMYNEVKRIADKIKSAFNSAKDAWSNAGANISFALGGARATGGPVSGGSSYLVGETGPEIFTPGASGFITPNNRLGGGGNIIIQLSNNTFMGKEGIAQMIAGELMGEIKQQMRVS